MKVTGAPAPAKQQGRRSFVFRHCEDCEAQPTQDEAIHSAVMEGRALKLDCFAYARSDG